MTERVSNTMLMEHHETDESTKAQQEHEFAVGYTVRENCS